MNVNMTAKIVNYKIRYFHTIIQKIFHSVIKIITSKMTDQCSEFDSTGCPDYMSLEQEKSSLIKKI